MKNTKHMITNGLKRRGILLAATLCLIPVLGGCGVESMTVIPTAGTVQSDLSAADNPGEPEAVWKTAETEETEEPEEQVNTSDEAGEETPAEEEAPAESGEETPAEEAASAESGEEAPVEEAAPADTETSNGGGSERL